MFLIDCSIIHQCFATTFEDIIIVVITSVVLEFFISLHCYTATCFTCVKFSLRVMQLCCLGAAGCMCRHTEVKLHYKIVCVVAITTMCIHYKLLSSLMTVSIKYTHIFAYNSIITILQVCTKVVTNIFLPLSTMVQAM